MVSPLSDQIWFPYRIAFAVGTLVLLKKFIIAIRGFYATFLRPARNLKKYGSWSIITGATDGIGKAFAEEMARKGINVLLISRTQSKLENTMAEIQKKYPNIQVRILAIDFCTFDAGAREKVSDAIQKLDVGVLINNVGASYPYPMYFHELEDEIVDRLINVNINSTCWMTRLVVPGMVNRGRGSIVNISSISSRNSCPLLTVYSATKAFIDLFSQSLDAELKSKGIRVQAQCPAFITTKLSKIRKSSLTVPKPKQYVRYAVAAIGHESLGSPYWSHKFMLWAMSYVPQSILESNLLGMHLKIRKRALKKLAMKQS